MQRNAAVAIKRESRYEGYEAKVWTTSIVIGLDYSGVGLLCEISTRILVGNVMPSI